jgi:hypothetical protein
MHNVFNLISRTDIDYFHGATVMQSGLLTGGEGVTLGSSITLSKGGSIDYDNTTLLHYEKFEKTAMPPLYYGRLSVIRQLFVRKIN